MKRKVDYFCSESLRQNLKAKTVRGGLMTGSAQVVRLLIGMASIPILARLLDPADFGLVAMVTVFTGLAAMFVDSGLSMATVQRQELTHQQVSNLLWIASSLGLLVALVVVLVSPLVSWFYGEPRLTAIMCALASSCVFSGLTLQHQALMRRAMQFSRLATASVISPIVGQTVAITWAWHYEGQPQDYWALVLLPIATSATNMVAVWTLCSWRPGLPRRRVGTRELTVFGANLTGFSFVNYLARNTDNLLIGYTWGSVALGYYDRAYKLFLYPVQMINGPLSSVMVPALSRMISTPDKLHTTYARVVTVLMSVLSPLIVMTFITADWWIECILGARWMPCVPIFRWLLIAGSIQPFTNSAGWIFIAQNKTREMFHAGAILASITIASFLVGIAWGPTAVAAAYGLSAIFIRLPLLLFFLRHYRVLPLRKLRALATNLCIMIPLIGTISYLMVTLHPFGNALGNALLTLAACLITMAVMFVLPISGRVMIGDIRHVLNRG